MVEAWERNQGSAASKPATSQPSTAAPVTSEPTTATPVAPTTAPCAGQRRELTFRDTHFSCSSHPECPAGWAQLQLNDRVGCKDEVKCAGCCVPETKVLDGWFCGTCQSGWTTARKQRRWGGCKVTCEGCAGTWSDEGHYGAAAELESDDATGNNDDRSAPRPLIAGVVAGVAAAAVALGYTMRRRAARRAQRAPDATMDSEACPTSPVTPAKVRGAYQDLEATQRTAVSAFDGQGAEKDSIDV